jgi:hypothetical protein
MFSFEDLCAATLHQRQMLLTIESCFRKTPWTGRDRLMERYDNRSTTTRMCSALKSASRSETSGSSLTTKSVEDGDRRAECCRAALGGATLVGA